LLLIALLRLRPLRFPGVTWFLFRIFVSISSESKQKYKNKAIGYLIKDLSDSNLSIALNDFKNKVRPLYRPLVLSSIHQAISDGCTVLIVSASPSFAIIECLSNLSVTVLGTEFEKKGNIYNGLLKTKNCYGQEKVNRINQWALSNNIKLSVQSAWGDNLSDYDMLSLSPKRYWIREEKLYKKIIDRDPNANFVDK
jgi:phosphoserine phosphatase